MTELGERTIWIDCDVIQADGGTRTASITGAFVAMVFALDKMKQQDMLRSVPVNDYVAATSVGIVGGMPLLDLAYDDNLIKPGPAPLTGVDGPACEGR